MTVLTKNASVAVRVLKERIAGYELEFDNDGLEKQLILGMAVTILGDDPESLRDHDLVDDDLNGNMASARPVAIENLPSPAAAPAGHWAVDLFVWMLFGAAVAMLLILALILV